MSEGPTEEAGRSWNRETMKAMPARDADALGLYLSIPFCRSKCTYCNFASGVYPASEHARYVDRLIEDLDGACAWADRMGVELPGTVDSIYLGGGTPSLLPPDSLVRLFSAIRATFQISTLAEVTMECAPGQISDEVLRAIGQAGVNRVSLGAQSFVDREAAVSGRLHRREDVVEDVRRLRAAGIDNLNVDLIAGLAGQTLASWDESLGGLISTDVPHASIYMLEVDEDSKLGREVLSRGERYFAGLVPSDDSIVRMYSTAIEALSAAGLEQYEISNFSRPGHESRHNLRYWLRRPYLGVGLDASSALRAKNAPGGPAQRDVLRSTSTSDMASYLAGPSEGEAEWISPRQQHEEAWFLGLRRSCGVRLDEIESEFGAELTHSALEVVHRLAAEGWLTLQDGLVRLTAEGRPLANEVFEQFIEMPQPCAVETT